MTQTKKKTNNKGKKLTLKQSRFIDKYIETGNATEAANTVYKTNNRHTAQAVGSENLSKPIIQANIEERLQTCKNIIYGIATKETAKDEVRIKAAQDVIDRIEGKAIARTEVSGKDGGPIQVMDLKGKSMVELEAIRQELLNKK